MRWSISPEAMRQRLDAAIAHETGYNLTKLESASFNALPWPNVLATNLELTRKDGSGERAQIPLLKARISLASWLLGQPRITAIGLRDPVLHLPSNDATADTAALSSTLFNVLKPETVGRIKTVRVHGGSVVVAGETILKDLHMQAADVATADFRVVARAQYHGVPFQLTAEFGKNGRDVRRPLNWHVTSQLGDISFNGLLLGPRSLDAEGYLIVRTATAKQWQTTLRQVPPLVTLFGGTAVMGEARAIGALVQMQNASIVRDEQTLTGSLAFSIASGLPQVSATLDVERFDLSALLPAAAALVSEINAPWSTRKLPTAWMDAGRIDLRLSARKFVLGTQIIDQAAGAMHLSNGKLEAMLSDGRIGRGNLKARIVIARSPSDELELRTSGSFDRMDAASILPPLGVERLKGTAHGNFTIDSFGTTIAELVSRMEGRAALLMRDGDVAGADLERLLARMERGAAIAPVALEGRTSFKTLSTQFNIQRGVAELTDSQLSSALVRVPLTGSVNLGARILSVTARLKTANGSDPRTGDFTLRAEGPWSKLTVSPDLKSRGERS